MMGIEKEMTSHHRDYIEFYLPFYSILSLYSLGNVSALNVGTIGLLIISVLSLIEIKGKFRLKSYHSLFVQLLVFLLIRDFIRIIGGGSEFSAQINRIIEYTVVFFLAFVVTSKEKFNEEKLYGVWKIVSIAIFIGEAYHLFQLLILHQRVYPITIIPGYVFRENLSIYGSTRPLSLFSEPGGIATALIPMLFLSLKRKDFRWAVFVTLVTLASTSTVGVLLSGILWIYSVAVEKDTFKHRFLIVFAILLIVAIYMNADIFEQSFRKLSFVVEGESTFNSRVANGFRIVGTLDPIQFVFGTRFNEVSDYVALHSSSFSGNGMVLAYWTEGRLFINTICSIIIKYGLVGLIFYLRSYIGLFRTPHYRAKSFIIVCIVSAFGQSVFLNSAFFMNIILLFMMASESRTSMLETNIN